MTGTVLVEEEIRIAAPRESVFALLTTVEGLLQWMAVEAECEPVAGGRLRWRHENGAVMAGRFVSVEPPARLAFTYGWESGGPDLPPESTLVEIELQEGAGGTLLRLVHSRLPPKAAGEHRVGWQWFLQKLAQSAAGGANAGTGKENP